MEDENKKLYFATSSDVKFEQYKVIFEDYGYVLHKAPLIINLIEPQLNDEQGDFELLVSHPLRLVARFVSKQDLVPYIVEDTLLVIKEFSNSENTKFGLPGADTKSWWNNLGIKGLLKLMKDIDERDAEFVSVIGGYFGGRKYVFSEERIKGTISKEELTDSTVIDDFPYTNPHFFHSIFIPENAVTTYAQMKREEFMKFDYRRKNVGKFIKELQDFYHHENIQPSFDFS